MSWQFWSVFILASLPVHFTPGPNNLLALRNGGLVGARAACLSMLGRLPGYLIIFIAAGLGLAAVMNSYPGAFSLLKITGGLYLAWLGASTVGTGMDVAAGSAGNTQSLQVMVHEKFVTSIANRRGSSGD